LGEAVTSMRAGRGAPVTAQSFSMNAYSRGSSFSSTQYGFTPLLDRQNIGRIIEMTSSAPAMSGVMNTTPRTIVPRPRE